MKLEDLKVGQYVRFKDKRGNTYIRNIKEVCNENPQKSWGAIIIDKNANNVPYVSLKNIIKASYNIIDILENWDFVSTITGECALITGIYHDINGKKYIRLCNCIGEYYEDDIKSVITHEQMEQMAYKVGE